ncbi:hypothetical protein BFJ66_g3735 [Fusarium oxysporum f. sp. cepae]|nr:hypothetical protein BFJ66_g3735 [Fusarium oxysporum f. sp. cepae]
MPSRSLHRIKDEAPMYQHFRKQLLFTLDLQQKIFEQRAWIFCDDGRLYPLEITVPHFPSERFLEDEPENMGWFEGLGTLRCHSQE